MDMSAFVRRYAEEAGERVREIEGGIARLEASPRDRDLVNHLMRQAHTVKGGARMLRLKRIQDLSHAMEDAMSAVGAGKRVVTPLLVDALMAATKALRDLLAGLVPGDPDPEKPAGVDVAVLSNFVRTETPPPGWVAAAAVPPPPPGPEAAPGVAPPGDSTGPIAPAPATGDRADLATSDLESAMRRAKAGASVRVAVSRLNALGSLTVEMAVERARARNLHARLESLGFAIARARAGASRGGRGGDSTAAAFLDLERLHRRLVEESEDEMARRAGLDEEVRDHVQALRLTPVRMVFDPFPASVREIARGLGKEVDLVVAGGETELDRRIVDEIGEPLVHLVRNALDHGIEAPADREKAGKPRRGRLEIRASAAEGAILVEVADDGRGIDTDRLRQKAVARGVMSKEDAARLTDDQVVELIFLPGFSTKEAVTELSGRGVGMDTVRVSVGRLGGTVSVRSERGKGTRTVCRLPLTLALLRVLLFRVRDEVMAVPLAAAEWVGSFATAGSFGYDEGDVGPLPVASVAEFFGFAEEPEAPGEPPPSFLVIRAAGSRAMFVVDDVLEEAEVALKEAPSYLRWSRLVSGVTLLGTGDAAVVLEPAEMVARAVTRRARPVAEAAAEQ